MTFKDIVMEYAKDSSTEVMEYLTHKVDKFVEEVREENPQLVDKFLHKVDLLLNPHFTKETAKLVVSKMENKDGSIGEHWDYDTAVKVLHNKGLDFNSGDWYYVLNMMYSDYYKSGRSDDTYIDLAIDFLDDIDAPEDKAKKYWRAMHY